MAAKLTNDDGVDGPWERRMGAGVDTRLEYPGWLRRGATCYAGHDLVKVIAIGSTVATVRRSDGSVVDRQISELREERHTTRRGTTGYLAPAGQPTSEAERIAHAAEQRVHLMRDEMLANRATIEDVEKAERERDEAFRRAGIEVP